MLDNFCIRTTLHKVDYRFAVNRCILNRLACTFIA